MKKIEQRSSVVAMALVGMASVMTACGGGGNSISIGAVPESIVLESTPPNSITELWASSAGSNQINLAWNGTTDNISTSSNLVYEICQSSATAGCDSFTVSATTDAGANSYSISGLTFATEYFFKIRAKDEAGNTGAASNEVLAVTSADGVVNTPTFSPIAKTYGAAQSVVISTTTPAATMCYTNDGTTPVCDAAVICTVGTEYVEAINVDISQTLKAVSCSAGLTNSSVVSSNYVIDAIAPAAINAVESFPTGESQVGLDWAAVTDSASAVGDIVYEVCQSTIPAGCETFTADYVTSPGATFYMVSGLNPSTDYYFQVRAKDEAGNTGIPNSEVMVTTDVAGTVNAPTFNIVAGTYESDQSITISSSTSGATIYYTTNGKTPSVETTVYTGAIDVTGDWTSMTIRAMAVKTDMVNSFTSSSTYDIRYPVTPKTISVSNTNATALTDFQVRVVLDSSFDFTDFSDTGNEVRFYNGSQALDYYVESFDKADQAAVYWIKVDSLAANASTNITLNPYKIGLTAASNGNNTFVFFDGFERAALGSAWTIAGSGEGTIGINNGLLELHGIDGNGDNYISSMYTYLSDIPGMAGSDSFVAGAKMYRDYNSDQYWKLNGVNAAASNYASRGLWLVNNDTTSNSLANGTWKTYQITVDNVNNITYERGNSLDSLTEQLTGTRVAPATPYMQFWYAYAVNGYVKVDWVFIRKFASVDPTVSY